MKRVKGRRLTTGRFATRAEFEERVRYYALHTTMSEERIGKSVGSSQGAVHNVLHPPPRIM